MLKRQVEPYLEFTRSYYIDRDSAHDFQHIQRIISRLDFLSQEVSSLPRKELLYFIACFHGLSVNLRDDKSFRDRTVRFLLNLEWTKSEISEAFASLARHLNAPQTVEEAIVHDANYIELLGAFGIAKAFTTGGARKQTYQETSDIFEYRFLDKVQFLTPAGKRIAQEKRAYTKEFLKQLRSEL